MSAPKKSKVRLSKLLSFVDCARPRQLEAGLIGSPGFSRVVFCNEPEKHSSPPTQYMNNYISTTKYNAFTFLPRALFEQFRRIANVYFLAAAILGLTPLSPYEPLSLIAPLVLVIGVSMTKEAIEDYSRWLADQEVNKRLVAAHGKNGVFENKKWQELQVGDIVKVEKDAFFPADLLLLSSSYEDGVCYVETMNLDGETNLKLRKALEVTTELQEDSAMADFRARINCEDPNALLYEFVGNLSLNDTSADIGPQQVLLRDSKLRNTAFVYGVCIFTGRDTKVMQNATAVRSKRSRMEKLMDKIILMCFSLLLILSVTGAIVFGIRTDTEVPDWWYLRPDSVTVYFDPSRAALAGILQAVTNLVLYGYLIPISFYVTIEIVKVIQARHISADLGMYFEDSDTPARARTSNLNEELGQVDTVLSDKTGTLTCNQMEFLKFSVAGVAYGKGVTEVELATARRLGKDPREMEEWEEEEGEQEEKERGSNGRNKHVKGFAFRDSRIMGGQWVHESDPASIAMFLTILSVCHTAIPEEAEEGAAVQYEAESPDEAAFVVAAQQMGYEFFKRTQRSVFVRQPKSVAEPHKRVEREYEVLQLLEFNSARKRMSVVVRDTATGKLFLFTKGADSVIFERLSTAGKQHLDATRVHLARYGDAGLRTLALAYRELNPEYYRQWSEEYKAARETLGAERESLLEAASEKIEAELWLVGSTAVEDKLQAGVPETIDKLAQAGIKIWVLTGDKMETAINIGFACSLLRQDMTQIVISLDNPDIRKVEDSGDKDKAKAVCKASVAKQLTEGASLVEGSSGYHNGSHGLEDDPSPPPVFALIIDGKSLTFALEDVNLKSVLLALAMQCASVICCRVSPKQKATVTRLVKEGTGKVTLGIGDGANDVGMIQEADIGVGISGLEGQQAVMASDFAIAQFRFLERLLLVHGHWCNKRIANMVTYFFYKNLAFGMTLFYFNAYAAFSGQIMYNSWYTAVYNVIFTSLPVIALGALEQDVSAKTCLQFPVLYQMGPQNLWLQWRRILFWMLNGIYVSAVGFWVVITAMSPQAFRKDGRLPELPGIGVTLYSAIVWTVNLQIFLVLDYITWIHHLLIWGSIALFYLFAVVYGYFPASFSTDGFKLFTEVVGPSGQYWFLTLLVPPMQLLPYLVYKCIQIRFNPMDHQIVQELVYLKKDVEDPSTWQAEGHRAALQSNVGFTAAVESVVKRMRRKGKLPKSTKPVSVLKAAQASANGLNQ